MKANNVQPLLLLVKPRPVIIPPQNPGDTLSTKDSIKINITVKSEFPVSRVNFTYRKPTDSTALFSKDMPLGGPYTGTVPRNILDEIGAEYAFYAIDSVGSKSLIAEGSLTVNHPRGVKIPYNSYGKEQRNYRIISVPLVLKYNRVDSMLHKSYGKYNDKRFRIYNYTNGSNIQFTNGLTEIKPGKGYWFISKDSSYLPFVSGEGRTVVARTETPFSVELIEGWNQIGNPYNMDIYWSDILNYKKNNKNALDGFKKWEGDWASGEVIKKMEGGFVLAKSPTTLYFPTQKRKPGNKNLRIAAFEKKVDELNWEVPFLLQSEEQTCRLAGIGMDEHAKASRDDLDDLTPPRFLDYLEINFNHPEYYYPKFTKDMVRSDAEHVWEFTV